ncbi:MAG: hypothetical protein HC849_24780 [Oscillatoriales cyanobacterium RU_3_3]|nr:hypothetical protein [Oscillatoriales cyanobacterium RU_3_3]
MSIGDCWRVGAGFRDCHLWAQIVEKPAPTGIERERAGSHYNYQRSTINYQLFNLSVWQLEKQK